MEHENWIELSDIRSEIETTSLNFFNKIADILDEETEPTVVEKNKFGFVTYSAWMRDGKLHRRNGPAVIKMTQDGANFVSQEWYNLGNLHSYDNSPAVIYYANGIKTEEHWYNHGELHRDGNVSPSIIKYQSNGDTTSIWYQNGKIERSNDLPVYVSLTGPSFARPLRDGDITYTGPMSKTIEIHQWQNHDGQLHRDNDLPAVIHYGICHEPPPPYSEDMSFSNSEVISTSDTVSSIVLRQWYKHGKLHRDKGPAIIHGNEESFLFYHEGVQQFHTPDIYVSFHDNEKQKIHEVKYLKNGKLHKDNGEPAWIVRDVFGDVTVHVWAVDGMYSNFHNKEIPQVVCYKCGYVVQSWVMPPNSVASNYHEYFPSGEIKVFGWTIKYGESENIFHREDGPAKITYADNLKTIAMVETFRYHQHHGHGDIPAVITFHENGKVKSESWKCRNILCRDVGKPAYIEYDESRNIIKQLYSGYWHIRDYSTTPPESIRIGDGFVFEIYSNRFNIMNYLNQRRLLITLNGTVSNLYYSKKGFVIKDSYLEYSDEDGTITSVKGDAIDLINEFHRAGKIKKFLWYRNGIPVNHASV
jgi:hypothetical protein